MGPQAGIGADTSENWLSELGKTQWLSHLSILLDGAVRVAWSWLARQPQCSLLVQCATGRDRSAQLSALVQLLLEPRFRSKLGFAALVRKEFGGFGFAFSQRFGTAAAPTERSPIFLQFLDAVHQLVKQCPASFEFTDAFLVDLVTFSGSEWWCDFLFDSERERQRQQVDSRCPSVWGHMLAVDGRNAVGESYTEPSYSTAASGGEGKGMLEVRVGPRHLVFWSELFLRYDADSLRAAEMRTPPAPAAAAGLQAAPRGAGGAADRASKGGPAVKWHPHAPGRALVEGGVTVSALQPELVGDKVLYSFELRVGFTSAGVLQTRYSSARAAHQTLSKDGT